MNNYHTVTDSNKFREFIKTNKFVVVDFFATWCGPCKVLTGIFNLIEKNKSLGPNVKILKIDVDQLTNLASDFQIQAMPTVIFIKDGKEVDRFFGPRPESEIIAMAKKSFGDEARIK